MPQLPLQLQQERCMHSCRMRCVLHANLLHLQLHATRRLQGISQPSCTHARAACAGCQGSCSDQLPPVVAKQGFKGAQTMPRQLRYSRATKTLCAYPVPEVQALRGKQVCGF